MKFKLIQYKIFRKFFKGVYFLIDTDLMMYSFWSNEKIKSCNARVLKVETFGKKTWSFIGGIGKSFFEETLKADTKEQAIIFFKEIHNKTFVMVKEGNPVFKN